MFKKLINKIKSSIWLYPTMYSFFALLLVAVVTVIDRLYAEEIGQYIHSFFYTNTDLAESVLSIVAASFITIATFTFSTTMIVLTMYSSQFTPRVVENFLNNQTTMKSFGVFLSGFIYAVTSLLFIDANAENNLVISASIGVVYVIVGLIYFLLFIHNVSTHIQANGLIERLYKEALDKINRYLDFIKIHKIISDGIVKTKVEAKNKFSIFSPEDGYIQEINYNKINYFAMENDCVIIVNKVVGQFISQETRIISIYHQGEFKIEEDQIKNLQRSFLIGIKKTETQDFSFTIQKINEIAIKALSPGINDPNTSIHCLKNIGILLRDLASIENGFLAYNDSEEEQASLFIEAYDFERIIYDAFYQITLYGHKDASVVVAIFKALRVIKGRSTPENVKFIHAYGKYLYNQVGFLENDKMAFRKIQKEYQDLFEYH